LSDSFDQLIQRVSTADLQSLTHTLQDSLSDYSTASLTTAAATLLTLLFLLARYLMSYRNSFSSLYGSGRASPYTSTIGQDGRSFSDLYEYVGPGDVDPRGGYSRSSQAVIPELQHPVADHEAPDVIHVRYMASIFSVDFPAYSISESTVTAGDLRRKVAHRLGQDHRRVRLVYKDTDLEKDRHSIKHYGCKQNSEVSVVLTEHLSDHGEHPSSEEEVAVGHTLQPVSTSERGRRPRGNSSVRYRSDEFGVTPDSNGLLHPLNGVSHNRRRSPSRDGARTRSPSHQHLHHGLALTQIHPWAKCNYWKMYITISGTLNPTPI
jgi:hypothetical protein